MLDLAMTAAKEAGKILKENFGNIKNINRKDERELVSNVDVLTENRIIEIIKSEYPEHNILCEESKWDDTNSDYRWVIDPLDGTHNYIYGVNMFGVSIALEYKNEIILGVVNMPDYNQIYWAEKGKGAYLNGEPIFVSDRTIKNALAIFDSGLQVDTIKRTGFLSILAGKVFNTRMFGASTRHLTYIASGVADLVVEFGDRPWDFAAGGLILTEAGGMITQLDGSKWSIYVRGYVASNGKFHDEIIELLKPFI
ncbi:MAG: inositol monophosphatase family protein [bacterium]